MRPRCTAAAIALVSAALAAAGCGFGAGAQVGEVSLTVTRDYGAEPLLGPLREEIREADTVMRVLEGEADITTRYGGGFVRSIGGLAEAAADGRRRDWFFFVDGVESAVGAADYPLAGGEAIWWDYREWSAASRVPAVVGSFPRPLVGGYDGRRRPVTVECRGGARSCREVRARLSRAGVVVASGSADGAIRVLVGPWGRLRADPAAAQLEDGPQASGVFARFAHGRGGFELHGLDVAGESLRELGPNAGLLAATRRYDAPPVWLVSGVTDSGVLAAARLLEAASLRHHYAVAIDGDEKMPLPLR